MTPRPTRRQKEHRRDRNNANQLKMSFLTPRPTRRQNEHRRDSLLTPRPTRRQKERRRDRHKKMVVF